MVNAQLCLRPATAAVAAAATTTASHTSNNILSIELCPDRGAARIQPLY